MGIQLDISPGAKAFLILTVGVATIFLASANAEKFILKNPKMQILDQAGQNTTSPPKASEIHMIKEDGSGLDKPKEILLTAEKTNSVFSFSPSARSDVAPAAIDYFDKLTSGGYLRADALTDNGAIINGKYVAVGSEIDSMDYPAPGANPDAPAKTLKPKLSKVSASSLTVTEPIAPYRSHTFKFD